MTSTATEPAASPTEDALPPPPPPSAAPSDGVQPASDAASGDGLVLAVPYRSQYDGSPYQNSNCGPAALAMVLQAYGVQATNAQVRAAADLLQGTSGYNDGVAIGFLQAIAQENSLRTEGLTGADGHYRTWSLADLVAEVRHGYPVITLVHYATLPDHAASTSTSDHYIVVIGVSSQGLIVNDPAFTGNSGYRRLLAPDALMKAWRAASIPDQAVAFLPPVGKPNLAFRTTAGAQTDVSANHVAILPTDQPAQRPAPLMPPGLPPGPAPSVVAGPSTEAIAPPPGPATASWAVGLTQWRHRPVASPTEVDQTPLPTATDPSLATTLPGSSSPVMPIMALLVAGLIGGGAFLILWLPGSDSS